ncbi:MAG: phenylacetate--CoA ligase, partial [Spirochaetales bacterium]|nr:phenylacetate--CoA ligase [Spirochaetales bacterium]
MTCQNEELETLDREGLKALQLFQFKKTVNHALKTPFYRERLGGVGIVSARDIKSLEDIRKIPYTTK